MAEIQSIIPVIMSSDPARTADFLTTLGFNVTFKDDSDHPKYMGMQRDRIEVHIQWYDLSNIPLATDRPTIRFVVDDVEALATELTENGLSSIQPFSTPWGTREFHLQDEDRNGYQFYTNEH